MIKNLSRALRGNTLALLLLLLLLPLTNDGTTKWRSDWAVDFIQFWIVGQAVNQISGIQNIYATVDKKIIRDHFFKKAVETGSHPMQRAMRFRGRLGLAGTPFLYTCFYLISTGDYERDHEIYRLLSLLFYVAGILVMCWLLRYSPWAIALAFVPLLFHFWPLKSEILAGNVNELQLGALAFFLLALRFPEKTFQGGIAGFILGMMVMFKPNLFVIPGLLAASWIVQKRSALLVRVAAGMAVGMVLAWAISNLLLSPRCTWEGWFWGFQTVVFRNFYLRNSFLGMFIGADSTIYHRVLGGLLCLLPLFIVWKKFGSRDHAAGAATAFLWDFALTSMGILVYLLSGPLIHGHYFLLTIPTLLFLLRPSPRIDPSTRTTTTHVRYFFAILGFFLVSWHERVPGAGLARMWQHSDWNFYGTVVLYLTLLGDLHAGRWWRR